MKAKTRLDKQTERDVQKVFNSINIVASGGTNDKNEEIDEDDDVHNGADQIGVSLQHHAREADSALQRKENASKNPNKTTTTPSTAAPSLELDVKPVDRDNGNSISGDHHKAGHKNGVVYVGRIPHGFYENEMRQYFSQFGTISRIRLSRNRKTGHSKHFAFIEFERSDVAKIAAEAMDNYLMFGHILKCKLVPPQRLHPDTFRGADRKFRTVPRNKIEKRILEKPRTDKQWAIKNEREQAKRRRKLRQLEEMGYQIKLPELRRPDEVLQRKHAGKQNEQQTETEELQQQREQQGAR